MFGSVTVSGADEVTRNWDAIKAAERATGDGPVSALDGVPFGQPALALAAQLQGRAQRGGFLAELAAPDDDDEASRLGAELFALVAKAREAGLDPELELRAAARRYASQVRAWERARTRRPEVKAPAGQDSPHVKTARTSRNDSPHVKTAAGQDRPEVAQARSEGRRADTPRGSAWPVPPPAGLH